MYTHIYMCIFEYQFGTPIRCLSSSSYSHSPLLPLSSSLACPSPPPPSPYTHMHTHAHTCTRGGRHDWPLLVTRVLTVYAMKTFLTPLSLSPSSPFPLSPLPFILSFSSLLFSSSGRPIATSCEPPGDTGPSSLLSPHSPRDCSARQPGAV